MPFDPFGDYATRGYLRNVNGLKNPALIKREEHYAYKRNVQTATAYLQKQKTLSFKQVKQVHHLIFGDFYPWAGQDRGENAAHLLISKAGIEFQLPQFIATGVTYALNQAEDSAFMRAHPGTVLGNLCYAHPFLDGNGRTILTCFAELLRRAKMRIDWNSIHAAEYLRALAQEIEAPNHGYLDAYLQPFCVD